MARWTPRPEEPPAEASTEPRGSAQEELSRMMGATGRATKRSNKRGLETRKRIIAAASQCFAEYGYAGTRISDIVHLAGTAQGNFYRHFSGLDDVFLAALEPCLEDLANARGSDLGGADRRQSLVERNTAFLESYSRNRHLLRVMREAASIVGNDDFRRLWLKLRGDFVARTHRWLVRLQATGEIGDGDFEMLAEALGCMTEQVAYVHIGLTPVSPRAEDIRRMAVVLSDVWERALPDAAN